MKRVMILALVLVSSGCASRTIRCRTVAFEGTKIHKGAWQVGDTGCTSALADAKIGDRLFGDVIDYGVQVQGGKQRGVLMLKDQKTKQVTPGGDGHMYVLPMPEEKQ